MALINPWPIVLEAPKTSTVLDIFYHQMLLDIFLLKVLTQKMKERAVERGKHLQRVYVAANILGKWLLKQVKIVTHKSSV